MEQTASVEKEDRQEQFQGISSERHA